MSKENNKLVLKENYSVVPAEERIEQPRQPRNMEDLLRYAIEVENMNSSAASRDNVGPLEPERRQFLENVISSMTVDISKEIQKALSILQQDLKKGDSPEQFEDAFEQILDFIDNIDIANDFFKMGGFDVCKKWLVKGSPGLRWRAASVIGECCQNNPFCQAKALEEGFLKLCMDLTEKDENEMVQVKSFHAVSCIVRNNENTLLNFLSLNGHKLILNCLKSQTNRLKTKASFFTSAIANKEPMLMDQLWDIGLVNELVGLITNAVETRLVDDVACFEQCLSALLVMMKDSKRKLDNETGTVECLQKLSQCLKDPAYLESVDNIKAILKIIDPKMDV